MQQILSVRRNPVSPGRVRLFQVKFQEMLFLSGGSGWFEITILWVSLQHICFCFCQHRLQTINVNNIRFDIIFGILP